MPMFSRLELSLDIEPKQLSPISCRTLTSWLCSHPPYDALPASFGRALACKPWKIDNCNLNKYSFEFCICVHVRAKAVIVPPDATPFRNVDAFSGRGAIAKAFQRRGHRAARLDISLDERDEAVSALYVIYALDIATVS